MFDQKTAVFWSFVFILALTLLRVLALAVTPTDLFVDEAQYWFWGQNLDFGYYSKPPLIAWLIRFVTELANSSEAFWVRLPAPLLHGITAVLLGYLRRGDLDVGQGLGWRLVISLCPLLRWAVL